MELKLTDENFQKEIDNAKKPVLVDFFAQWCGPCQVLGPILEEISKENDNFILAKVDVDQAPQASQRFKVEKIPTVVLFKDKQPISGFVGMSTKEDIKNWINKLL